MAAAAAAPIAARDGDQLAREHAITFGLAGGLARATPDALVDLQRADLSFVVSAGDAVDRGSARRYRAVQEALGALPVVPLPGPGEARGDPDLSRFFRAWDGLGVRESEDPVTWRSFDLVPAGAAWRVVVLDADDQRLGETFLDELIWLPRVVGPAGRPLLVVANAPVGTLVAGDPPPEGAARLHELIRRHSEPMRAPLFAAAGNAPEFVLPGGRWGEAWLGVGQISGPPATLRRIDPSLIVEDSFDAALIEHFAASTDVSSILARGDYVADRFPLEGWWRITVGAADLTATLRMREIPQRPSGWTDVFTIRWTREGGWTATD